MTDKSLRLQILEYLKENGGEEDNIDIKTPFSHLLSDMDGRRKYLKAIGSLLEDGDIKLTNESYQYMAYESGGMPKEITGVSILAKLKKADKTAIGNIHIGDNYGNYNQLLDVRDTIIERTENPNKKPSIISSIISWMEKYWWGIAVPIIVGIILLAIENKFFK